MENFQNNLSYMSYGQDLGKISQADGCMLLSSRSTNLSENEMVVSEKSPTFSHHSMYQSSGLHSVSVHPAVYLHNNSHKYNDKDSHTSAYPCRVVGLDMTNKNTSVNLDLNSKISEFDLKARSVDVSKPTATSTLVSTSSYSNRSQSGDSQIKNIGNNFINLSTAGSSNEIKDNNLPFGLHTNNRCYLPCEEKHSIDYMFTCGGCEQRFYTICNLHAHIKTHNGNGSYFFSETAKTAYPKFVKHCKGTQTGLDKYDTECPKVKIDNDTVKVSDTTKMDDESLSNEIDETFEDESEIKIEKDDCAAELDNISNSDSDTDDYKPEGSLLLNHKKKQKVSKRKHHDRNKINGIKRKVYIDRNKVSAKGSKNLKKLKMTIKLKQDERKEKKASFLKKDRKTKVSGTITVKRKKANDEIMCKLCKEEFTKRLFLRHHIKSKHSDVENLCQLCGEQFTINVDLIEHRKTVHNRGYHQCELCDKVLSTKGMLEGHYLVHKGIKPFACEICVPKKEFTRKCQLKAHMDTHSTEKTLQCEFCGKPFNARYLMLSHVKHCGGIKPHKCDYCEMSFVSNHCLQRHRRTHTGEKPFVCEVCAFASSNASCLSRHMRTHTGEKPFTCQFCQQSFAARGALKKHVRIHTQEKPYKCRFCTKAFTQNWNLKTHERQHTGETPYKCHVCGIGYKQNVLLKTHLRTHFGQNSESNESQNLAQNHSVSQSHSENQSMVNCPPQHSSMQTCSKSEHLKSEFTESQGVNSHSQITELQSHTQQLVPNMLLSSFLHSGYMN